MLDINILDKYIEPVDDFDVNFINFEVSHYGAEETYKKHLKCIDCTRIIKDVRLQETISYTYVHEMSQLYYLLNKYFLDDIESRLQEVVKIHLDNLKFEEENPPIIYENKGGRVKVTKKDKVVKEKTTKSKGIRKTAAERKLIHTKFKINALKFNIKPINNG